jgi:serine/threonine-protein kinase
MEPPNQSIGHYRILTTLGKGGMGTVYRALDTRIGREVALKVVTPGGVNGPEDPREASDRFRREPRSAGILSHPNVVTIHEFGETDRLQYIVMELVGGPGLGHLMEQQGRLEPRFVADVIRQAGGALDYAHRKGIVHRGIKPGNIMLGEGGLVKVADFGIARMLLEPSVTRTGFAVGTPVCMSPEQMRGEPP